MNTENIIEWINILKDKPKMVIAEPNIDYRILRVYLEGYITGIEMALHLNLMQKITKWYMNKISIQSSYYWTGYIPFQFEGKTDEELKAILLSATEEYFRDNPDWDIR